jgi:preprotein translocase subunit SecE
VSKEPKFSRMIAIVAGVVALTILVFFGIGYGFGRLML